MSSKARLTREALQTDAFDAEARRVVVLFLLPLGDAALGGGHRTPLNAEPSSGVERGSAVETPTRPGSSSSENSSRHSHFPRWTEADVNRSPDDKGSVGQHVRLPPPTVLQAALEVLHVCGYTTRNWTLSNEVSCEQINDLWEAVHEVPSLLTRWHVDAEPQLIGYLDEYAAKWPQPNLEARYIQVRDGAAQ